jgi:hypothetical protein
MTDFADFEPEDAWDRDDHPIDQLDNLRDRARLLYLFRTVPPLDTLDQIAAAVTGAFARALTAREVLRAEQLDEDITYLRTRL